MGWLGAVWPLALAAATTAVFEWRSSRLGLTPPAFASGPGFWRWPARRLLAVVLLAVVLWLAIFLPLTTLGEAPPDLSQVHRAQLFLLHAVFLLTLGAWYLLGFAGTDLAPTEALNGRFSRQFGLASRSIWQELGIGLAAGVGAWVVVLVVLIGLGVLIWAVGGDEVLPQQPPSLVPWMASLPIGLRLALSASAGLAEEIFFRGFLQPRTGVTFSTVLFVVAHVGYGQPLMLVGVTLLSLIFASLVRWRQNIWAAIVAHAVFDALQLTVVIPKALELLEGGGGGLV